MGVVTVVFTVTAAVVFAVAGAMKITGHPMSLKTRDRLGVSPGRWRSIGVLELCGVAGALIGLAYPPLGIAALTGLLLLSIGALGFHVGKRDPLQEAAPAVFAFLVTIAALALQIATA